MADAPAWRCPVCEGVNHGGRTCSTCGETLPRGYRPADAPRQPAPPTSVRVAPAPRAPRPPSPAEIFGSDPFR